MLQEFLNYYNSPEAQAHLEQLRTVRRTNPPTHIAFECADARCTFATRSPDTLLYCTAAQTITDQSISMIKQQYPSITSATCYSHQFCGGCAAKKALIENPSSQHLTPELLVLLGTMTTEKDKQNGVDIAHRFVGDSHIRSEVIHCELATGDMIGISGEPDHLVETPLGRKDGYPILPNGWDMSKGQNPQYIIYSLGLDFSPLDFVHHTPLDGPNTAFTVCTPYFDELALGSLQYAMSHAMDHPLDHHCLSFCTTQTLLLIAPASRQEETSAMVALLRANPVFHKFMTEHHVHSHHKQHGELHDEGKHDRLVETGQPLLRGRAFLLIHRDGVIQTTTELTL